MNRPSNPPALSEALPQVQPHAAGLDIGSTEIWVAVPADCAQEPVRRFGTFTPDLEALADWLATCHIQTVAMESTGVYWIPVFELLEARGFDAQVVNARHLKQVPGRKSDVQDCQWIQRLHSYGLLTGSFRPPAEICTLRAYLRQRATLIEHRAPHILHMQKALQQMNVQLPLVVKDITGETGQAIIRAILAGERDPVKLAQLRDPRCQHSEAEIAKALSGTYQPEHVFALKQAVALYDAYTVQLHECDTEIERQFHAIKPVTDEDPPPSTKPDSHSKNGPSYDARTLLYHLTGVDLCAIDGLNASTVQTVIAEMGTDLSKFPTHKHFGSYLGLAPHQDISGGKVLRRFTVKNGQRAGQAFRLAAQAVSRSASALGAFYRRLRAKFGPKIATVATAYKIARIYYHMLKERQPYRAQDADTYDQQTKARELRKLQKKAAKLGMQLVAVPA
ncbi:MAG: IS110 family transposase, partial [Anaerolineae bacterium]